MKKRTNNLNKVLEYIFISVLPILLIISFLFYGLDNSLEKILYVGMYLSNPQLIFKIDNEQVKSNKIDEMAVSDKFSEIIDKSTFSSVPTDIVELMKQAEKTYKESSNDGRIIEKDYSTQNATSEYNGIYVRNTTFSHEIDLADYLKRPVYANIDETKPSVLIYHTHTTETYELLDRGYYTNERKSRSENSKENMLRVGEEICKILEENGYKTIHDKTVYDKEYSGAYERSCKSISQILRNNPSIQIVLDIHRDAIYQKDGSRIKTVTEINGKKAAQIMLISGCEDGNVTNFPNWQKNLAFATQLQEKMKNDNSKLIRPLMFCSRKYNMHLMPCAISVEIGTDANTLAEAVYSAQLFANSLSEFLEEYKI